MEVELAEVMHEANSFREGWGQIIFMTAGEIAQNEKTKKAFHDIPKMKAEYGGFFFAFHVRLERANK